MRDRVVAGLAFALATLPALATAPSACLPQGQCETSTAEYCAPGDPACGGHLVDPYTWESGPIDTPWLDFRHQRYLLMHFRDGATNQMLQGTIYESLAWIAPEANPTAPGGQFTLAGGNLAEWSPVDATSATVHNDTCADYFLYVVVHATPNGATPDGGNTSQDAAPE